jgi:hypothetical protein
VSTICCYDLQYFGDEGEVGEVGEYFGDEGDSCVGAVPNKTIRELGGKHRSESNSQAAGEHAEQSERISQLNKKENSIKNLLGES